MPLCTAPNTWLAGGRLGESIRPDSPDTGERPALSQTVGFIMTVRSTALGVLALFGGVAMMWFAGGGVLTVVGAVSAVLGLTVVSVAGLFGMRTADPVRAQAAIDAKDAANTAEMKRASETGRWPRVIGGG